MRSVLYAYEAGLAINCISNILTQDLDRLVETRDSLPEVTNLTRNPNHYRRKKAILCLFKMFMKYPQGLHLTLSRGLCGYRVIRQESQDFHAPGACILSAFGPVTR